MQNSEVKLPPINSKPDISPFNVPDDNQMLLQGNNNKSSNNQKQKVIKIWDKKTASCRNDLKRFNKKFINDIDDKYVPITSFNNKEKKIIQNAMQIVETRKKNKDLAMKNQTVVDVLEQKKQIFLVTMTHEIIDKEINNMKNQASEREKALKESNQILEQDIDDFEQYQQKYKNQTKKIEQQFQKKVQLRSSKEQDIKNKQISVNSLRTQKSKNQEIVSSYLKYKKFLNLLPSKEWIEQKQNKKKQKLNEIKRKIKDIWKKQDHKKQRLDADFERYFEKIMQNGENSEIEEVVNNEQMYFKQPSELIEYFNNLQQSNLFCIQNSQYAQQKYQELKVRSQEKKTQLIDKYQGHKEQKRQLQKHLIELDNQIKQLKKKKEQNNMLDEKNNKDIKSMIAQQYQIMKQTMHYYMPQIQYNAQALSLLSCIQICMQRLWQKLQQCYHQNPKIIKQIKTQLQKKKNNEKRQETTKSNKIQQQKRKIRNLQKKQPTIKIPGRIDMKRSAPQDKIITKKIQITDKNMDDDKKYLIQ